MISYLRDFLKIVPGGTKSARFCDCYISSETDYAKARNFFFLFSRKSCEKCERCNIFHRKSQEPAITLDKKIDDEYNSIISKSLRCTTSIRNVMRRRHTTPHEDVSSEDTPGKDEGGMFLETTAFNAGQ